MNETMDQFIPKDRVYLELEALEKMMEEMAHMPTEELGKRQPGELCTYEKSKNNS